MTTATTDAREALGGFAEKRAAPRALRLGQLSHLAATVAPTPCADWPRQPFCADLRRQTLSTGQKRAMGLIGDAVPPASRSGAIVSRNSQRLRSAQAAASGPNRALSIRWTPM